MSPTRVTRPHSVQRAESHQSLATIEQIRTAASSSTRPSDAVVETVLGPIGTGSIGITHMHEHLLLDYTPWRTPNERAAPIRNQWDEPLTLENRHLARRNPYMYRAAVQMSSVDQAIIALRPFGTAGGGCIVELTPPSLGQDAEGLKAISESTGVNIVMGTGVYTHPYHTEYEEHASIDEIEAMLNTLAENGIGRHHIRPGIIGEIGISYPMMPCEKRALIACARVQRHTGLALSIHPGRHPQSPFDILDIVRAEGVDVARVVLGHLDRTIFDVATFKRLARTGCMLELDQFGMETWFAELARFDLPSNPQRIAIIRALRDAGHLEQVLVGQDIDNNMRRRAYGGEGYQHILEDVVPIMLTHGLTVQDLSTILIENPRRVLARTRTVKGTTTTKA